MAIGFTGIIDILIGNIGVSFEWTVFLIFLIGSLIFFAKDFKLGLMLLMVTMGAIFVWFYETGNNYTIPLAVFFMCIVILALSLYAVQKSSTTGGFTS